jgi:hypothetical protein
MNMNAWMRAGASAALVAALSACASFQPQTPEDAVMARAQQRWDLLMKKDFEKAYAYSPPSYRGVTPYADFRAKFGTGLTWKSVVVHSAQCEPERCQVKVRVEAQVPLMVTGARGKLQEVVSYYDEAWIREDGQWWLQEAL